MLCRISLKVPQEPVVSKQSGALFERRLIEKYIDEHGKCPITNSPLSKSDLLPVSAATGATQGVAGSIPSLLATLQSEWDAVMLEQFSLKQQLNQAHQELSHALYQHEASCRVIAKLIRERDFLAAQLKEKVPGVILDEHADRSTDALPTEIVEEIEYNMKRLKEQRLRRVVPHDLASVSDVASFSEYDSSTSHGSGSSASGVLSVSVLEGGNGCFAFTGGSDGRVVCYDVVNKAILSSLIGHTKAVRCVNAFDDMLVTGSDDSTIRVWKDGSHSYQGLRVIKAHRGPIVGISILPSKRHVLSAGADGRLAFTDFERGYTLATGESDASATGFSCLGLQPDGALGVTGSAGRLMIWDLRQMAVALVKGDGSQGTITSVDFNNDGYTMAASTLNGPVKLYDFRSIDKPLGDLSPLDSLPSRRISSNKAVFSDDGSYLAVASDVIRVWDWRKNLEITTLRSHSEPVTDVAWGNNAQWLASVSLDKTLKIFRKE